MEIASRELRNHTRAVLSRAANGEEIVITIRGRPTAVLQSLGAGSRWMSRHEFVKQLAAAQADPGLTDDLAAIAPDTTDDLP